MKVSNRPKKARGGSEGRDMDAWWYEDPKGILVLCTSNAGITHVRISWRELLRAARRCGAA